MDIQQFVKLAFEEDVRDGDHSSLSCIPSTAHEKARLIVKEDGIIAGVDRAQEIFSCIDSKLKFTKEIEDGAAVKYGDIAFYVEGSAQSLLKAERLVLNLMQRMSGIATYTHKVVSSSAAKHTKILDTRKTTPLLRVFEKEAVLIGGGHNHRFGLYDMIMLKDNHVDYAGGITKAISRARNYLKEKGLDLKIEIEVRNEHELDEVLEVGGVDRIMLDNFEPSAIKQALAKINGRFETEASGGITIDNVEGYAETGVDFISMGALTHSIKNLDMSLKAMK